MPLTIEERDRIWDKFLQRWPLESLAGLALESYTAADSKDSFAYWMEFATSELGSMRGGGAFKFGIYHRKGPVKEQRDHFKHDAEFSWYGKYSTHDGTREDAFTTIRDLVARCALAARQGRLEEIDSLDLGNVYKWKLAFLYQNRERPYILPVYSAEYLRAAAGPDARKATYPELYRLLMARYDGKPVFEAGDLVFSLGQQALADALTPEDALAYFADQPERFQPVKAPSQYIAGFQMPSGRQLALVRDNKEVTFFASPGAWLDPVRPVLGKIQDYPADRARSSNLAANAPSLSVGMPAVMIRVPTKAALIALCDAYDETGYEEKNIVTTDKATPEPDVPLNQVLYGPPGTGKTYATVEAALEILDPEFFESKREDRVALKKQFDALLVAGHIRFVTFHQSFSYEDFVEGLRAEADQDGNLRYDVVPGIFKSLCDTATARVTRQAQAPIDLRGRRIWKMSLGNTQGPDASIYNECIERGYALLGWGNTIDFTGVSSRDDVYRRFVDAGDDVKKDSYGVTAVAMFILKMKRGDLIVVSDGNSKFRAIGEVTGDYQCLDRSEEGEDYGQCRTVKWLREYKPSLPVDQLMDYKFSQMTLYELKPDVLDMARFTALLATDTSAPIFSGGQTTAFVAGERFGSGYIVRHASEEIIEIEKPNQNHVSFSMGMLSALADAVRGGKISIGDISAKRVFDRIADPKLEPHIVNGYNNILAHLVERLCAGPQARQPASTSQRQVSERKVLVIDEINRGNVSRIFGELITLIEPSKRRGEAEELEITLPYSKERFSVPANVYLIGTMNTADRSLAGLDIALRRRFVFKEMMPDPTVLKDILVDGVRIAELLGVMNQRIEALLNRDHCIGHAYFVPLRENPSLRALATVFRRQILPLLQEYFFEDWERIRWVLNDHRKPSERQFIVRAEASMEALFGEMSELANARPRWRLNDGAFDRAESYSGIIEAGH